MSTILAQLSEKLPVHLLSFVPLFLFIIFLYNLKWLFSRDASNIRLNAPPSPPKFPILGNLHQLGKFPHRSLASLSERYGKVMLVHLGNKPTVVVSSHDAALEIMKTHDLIFANRPRLRFIDRIFYDGKDVAFGRYGEDWKRLKSTAVVHLLSNKKVQSFRAIREEEVALMVQNIKSSSGSSPVNLSAMFLRLANDLVCRTALGRKYSGDHDGSTDFEKLFKEFTKVIGAFSVGDYIPWLGWIDRLTALHDRAEYVRNGFDEFLKKVIQEHDAKGLGDEDHTGENNVTDFVDVLLKVQKDDAAGLSADSIIPLILDMFAGGTEPTYTTIEWTMAEVVKHPRVLKELQEEVRGIVKGRKRVTEDDLENMKYLKATIKEALRLHPPAPMLLFREPTQDVKINGYDIPKGTQVIINAWAIQRDTTYWDNPEDFNPKRFLNSTIDLRGQHFQFIPFGAGRRGCPGASYGLTIAELVLATLVHEFDWKLPGGVTSETLDMTECAGLTIHLQNPLTVIATPRSSVFL